jgi:hypothetical protein
MTLELRRLGVASLASLLAHAAFVALVISIATPIDSGFEFSVPIDVELGLTDVTEVASAPPPEPVASPDPPTEGSGTQAGIGLDGGVPRDAGGDGGRRRRRDAGADGGALIATNADGGSPVAFLPAGAQIALRIDMDRIRASPLRTQVEQLLAAIPDWDAVLGGSGIDPVRDVSRVLIATPNFQRANIVVAGRLTDEAPAPREVAERVAEAHAHALEWSDEGGVEHAPFYSPDGADRVVAVLDDHHVLLCRPDDLPRVLAIANARSADGEPPADALLSMHEGEALSLEAEGLAAFVRRSPCEVARRARVAMMQADDGVTIDGTAWFETAEQATSARQCFDNLRVRYASNALVQMMGYSVPLYELRIEAEETRVTIHGALSEYMLRRLLEMVTGMLRPPPPPRVVPVDPAPTTTFPAEPTSPPPG